MHSSQTLHFIIAINLTKQTQGVIKSVPPVLGHRTQLTSRDGDCKQRLHSH